MGDGCGQGRFTVGGREQADKAGRGAGKGQLHTRWLHTRWRARKDRVELSRFARTYLERSVARHTRWHVEGERSTGSTIGRGRLPTRRPRLLLQQDGGEERGRRPDGKMRVAWVRERHRESSWYGWRGRACDMGCGWGKAGRSETILFYSSFAACAELKDPKVPRGSSHSDEYSVTNHSMWHGRIDSAKVAHHCQGPFSGTPWREHEQRSPWHRAGGASRTGGSGLCTFVWGGGVLERGMKAEIETGCRGSMHVREPPGHTPRRMRVPVPSVWD